MLYLASFCSSILLSQWQSSLLSAQQGLILGLFCCVLAYGARYVPRTSFALISFIAGLLYSNGFAYQRLQQVLPKALEQQTLSLRISLDNTPNRHDLYWSSQASIVTGPLQHRKIQLNWYQNDAPKPCAQYDVSVKLKRPHGLSNPAGFNYRLSLLERNITATGYVKQAQLIKASPFCLALLRLQWRDYVLQHFSQEQAAWLVALSIGDGSLISPQQYQLLQQSGLNHLFVISGLHIGLLASLVYGWILLLRRMGLGLLWQGDWRPYAAVLALIAASIYSALAGFAIPTQRSLLMLVVFFAGQVLGFYWPVWLRYFAAMAAVLLINPLAAGNIGFALSFLAVALLIICLQQLSALAKRHGKLIVFLAAQFYIAIGLSPLLLGFFQQTSVTGPVINLIAIPWVSFISTPLVLAGFFFWFVSGEGYFWLHWAQQSLALVFILAQSINQAVFSHWPWLAHLVVDYAALLVLAAVSGIFLLPRYWPGKAAYLLLLLLLLPALKPPDKPAQGAVSIKVLDVGQGLAVLVQTAQHQLLYDTGASWPTGSMAQRVIVPVLRHYGIGHLDTVLVSHWDNDHSGGVPFLKAQVAVDQWLSPVPKAGFTLCQKKRYWRWDDVGFIAVSLTTATLKGANQHSCVLLIKAAGKTLWLPGDIDKQAEALLLTDALKTVRHIDVLLAPHHGSKHSSSYWLVNKLKQGVVIFSTGYLNRYGHPQPSVEQRYQAVSAKRLNTALSGMVEVDISVQGNVNISSFREKARRYWDDQR